MKFKLILLIALILGLSNAELKAQRWLQSQCPKAKEYHEKARNAQSNNTNAANDNCAQGYAQYAAYYENKCYCEQELTDDDRKRLVATINASVDIIKGQYSDCGEPLTKITLAKCKGMYKGGDLGEQLSNKTATQIEMENRFKNYNTAMNLKNQGEAIAKAFAEQVKQFGEMGYAANPQEQLDNFNYNMQQISQMQSQNRTDNLNQLDNTVGTALNQLNAGNGEGALYSTLSLIDQRYEQKQAKKEAEKQKQNLIAQQKDKMSQFYWKAVELNNQAINNYLQIAAYSFSKADEDFNIAYASHHRCFGRYMKKNYNYTSTQWTRNNCRIPVRTNQVENNLVAKDIQYINAAKRKFKWFEESNNEDFREGAMRFAGAAATEKPKAEYYYLMGHYAGVDNPLVAYTSFEAAKSLDSNYFTDAKAGEYYLVSQALQASFKEAIESNNQEMIKSIIASQLHNAVKIDKQPAIIYAIKVDQPDVVQLFLNDYADGKSQTIISTKVQEVIMMAAVLDAPKTIQRFVDLGFFVDFELNGNNPVMVADEAIALDALEVLLNISDKQELYLSELKRTNSEFLVYKDILNLADNNDLISIKENYSKLKTTRAKGKVAIALLKQEKRETFFMLLELDSSLRKEIGQQKYEETIVNFFLRDIIDLRQQSVWKYVDYNLLPLDKDGELTWNYVEKPNTHYLLQHSILLYAIMERKDTKLVEVLLTNYNQINLRVPTGFVYFILGEGFYGHPYVKGLSEEEINRGIREYEIVNLLLDDQETKLFFTNEDFTSFVKNCFKYDYYNDYSRGIVNNPKTYAAAKKTVYRMIEEGFTADFSNLKSGYMFKKYIN